MSRIFGALNGGRSLDRKQLWLLRLTGRRLCPVADRQSVGPMDLASFYFHDRDRLEATLHEWALT
jgi:hypothetical protein